MITLLNSLKSPALFIVAISLCSAQNQPTAPLPHFEVASLKLSPPANGKRVPSFSRKGPGRVERLRIGLRGLIVEAYGVQWDQFVGPNTEHYDVVATMPPGTTRAQVPLMLQALLADRLKLVVHREQREEPVYAVEIARGGPKFREASIPAGADWDHSAGAYRVAFGQGAKTLTGYLSISRFLDLISPTLDHHMVDATGLKGVYDISLEWTPPDFRPPGTTPPVKAVSGDVPGASTPMTTDLFVAMEKQLGLKVVARKGSVDVIVVDHVDPVPIEN